LILGICFLALLGVFLAPALYGFTFSTILSESMTPKLKMGEVIGLKQVQAQEVGPGDIIGFKVEGMDTPVCHRVVEVVRTEEGIGFRTKGDASEDIDSWTVKPDNLLGKVIFHLPWLGYMAKFIKTRYGFGLLMGLPAVMVVGLEIRDLFQPERMLARRAEGFKKQDRTPAYLCLVVGLVVMGCLWGMMAGNTREKVLGSSPAEAKQAPEATYVSQRNIRNNMSFPLIICLLSEDSQATFSDDHFRLSPGGQKTVDIEGDSPDAVIITGCFFPLLPQEFLYRLFAWNVRFAPLVAAFIPIFPLMVLGFVLLGGFASSRPRLQGKAEVMRKLGYV